MRLPALLGVAVLALSAPVRADHPTGGVAGGAIGPINALSATTMNEGWWGLALRYERIDLERHSNAELIDFSNDGEEVDSINYIEVASLSIGYGVTDFVTVGARLPYSAQRTLRESDGAGGIEDVGDVDGLGDLAVYSQWRFFSEAYDDEGNALDAAVLAGLELPTGADREHADGELLEADHQPGSGTIDPFLGFVVTRSFERASLSADVIYTKATQGSQRTNLGDIFEYDLAWTYRLGEAVRTHEFHEDGTVHVHGTATHQWDSVVELNGTWKEEVHSDAEGDDSDTGGNRIMFAPGVRYTTDTHMSWYLSYAVPVLQNLNGHEHKTDNSLVLGMSWGF